MSSPTAIGCSSRISVVAAIDHAVSATTLVSSIPYGLFAFMLMYDDVIPDPLPLKIIGASLIAICALEGKRRIMRFFNQHFASNIVDIYSKFDTKQIKEMTTAQALMQCLNLTCSSVGSIFYAYCAVVAARNTGNLIRSNSSTSAAIRAADVISSNQIAIIFFIANLIINLIGFLPFIVPTTKHIFNSMKLLIANNRLKDLTNKTQTRQDIRRFMKELNVFINELLVNIDSKRHNEKLCSTQINNLAHAFALIPERSRMLLSNLEPLIIQDSADIMIDVRVIQLREQSSLLDTVTPSIALERAGIIAGFAISIVVYLGFVGFIDTALQMSDQYNLGNVRYVVATIEAIASYLLVFATNFNYGPELFTYLDKAMRKESLQIITKKQEKMLWLKNFIICTLGTTPMIYITLRVANLSLLWAIFSGIGSLCYEINGSKNRMESILNNSNLNIIKSTLTPEQYRSFERLFAIAKQFDSIQQEISLS